AEPEVLVAVAEVDDLLGAAIGGEAPGLPHPEGAEQPQKERGRALDATHRAIDVGNRDPHRGASLSRARTAKQVGELVERLAPAIPVKAQERAGLESSLEAQ